jgi:hypothetical protein
MNRVVIYLLLSIEAVWDSEEEGALIKSKRGGRTSVVRLAILLHNVKRFNTALAGSPQRPLLPRPVIKNNRRRFSGKTGLMILYGTSSFQYCDTRVDH